MNYILILDAFFCKHYHVLKFNYVHNLVKKVILIRILLIDQNGMHILCQLIELLTISRGSPLVLILDLAIRVFVLCSCFFCVVSCFFSHVMSCRVLVLYKNWYIFPSIHTILTYSYIHVVFIFLFVSYFSYFSVLCQIRIHVV